MPNQCHSGIIGIPWSRCDVCKVDYRLSELSMQDGRLRCQKCMDNPTKLRREKDVANYFQGATTEAENITAKVRSNPNLVRN